MNGCSIEEVSSGADRIVNTMMVWLRGHRVKEPWKRTRWHLARRDGHRDLHFQTLVPLSAATVPGFGKLGMAKATAATHQCNERARLAICKLHANNASQQNEIAEFNRLQERHEFFRRALSECTVALEELRMKAATLNAPDQADIAVHLGTLDDAVRRVSCADHAFRLAACKRPLVSQLPCPSPNCFSLEQQIQLKCGHFLCRRCHKHKASCPVCELTREPTINDTRSKGSSKEADPKALITIRMHENMLERVQAVQIGHC
eukprot:TRINITY_DN11020_c0_g1_i2.p1 TRINITY_DN11020_c0_g1~~TRINITY_DN11020_c0_g1_i2.p1  ORF type:complete len:261 (+),score=21.71 TRINITY_DN11020_c0_g1_i2:1144-1926(+)